MGLRAGGWSGDSPGERVVRHTADRPSSVSSGNFVSGGPRQLPTADAGSRRDRARRAVMPQLHAWMIVLIMLLSLVSESASGGSASGLDLAYLKPLSLIT